MPAEFHFLRPLWLLALLPLAAVVIWLARQTPGVRRWTDVVDAHLVPHVLIAGASTRSRLVSLAVGLAGALAVVALAGPAWQKLPQPVFASDDALVILLDLSQSMNTQDVKPSRLERARFKLADLLERRDEGQTALLVFAADAYVVSPLTDDTATIVAQLSALTPELMPSQGTRVDRALGKARELLQQAGVARGELLLVGDDVNSDRALPVARELAAGGFRVSVLGVGTPEGGPVPGRDGFLKDRRGSIVVAGLARDALHELAVSGGGVYQDLSPDDRDIEQLGRVLAGSRPAAATERDLTADLWREEGPWLLLPLLPLAALAFRRRVLFVLALLSLLPVGPAYSMEAASLWLNRDQRAARALAEGEAARAAELFEDRAWKGVASYRAGEYEKALEALGELDEVDAIYNRGNALARLGRFEEAIAAYERVIEREPEHDDAKFNRDLLLQQQSQQDQQQQGGESVEEGEQDASSQQQNQGGQSGDDDEASQSQSGQQDQAGGQPGADETQGEREPQQASSGSQGEQRDDADERESSTGAEQPGQAEQTEQEAMEQSPGEGEQTEDEQTGEAAMTASDQAPDESEQAVEQWLRRIPDDPGGLLRRKFLYQYRQREQPPAEPEQW